MRAEALMHGGAAAPIVGTDTPMRDVIYEMNRKGLGMTCVVGDEGRLAGIITDGDLRRHMSTPDVLGRTAADVMTPTPRTIPGSVLAVEALAILEERKISSLIVVDDDLRVRGVLHLHDLWRTEMF
jgi:arabinose-5-phosphate isomerase